uniref:HORMA domain-containing protein n=1 Tax=Oryza rufipogon TaxID=4529 RepID=A0A0E0MRT7_ORYRU
MEGDEEPPAAAAMAAVLTDDFLLRSILKCLCPRDVVRAALANKSWRRAAALAVPRTPPLVGYLLHPEKIRSAQIPPVFVPSDASFPRLSLPLAPDDLSGMQIKKLTPMDDESQRLVDWLEKGVYDALKKKFLKTIIFSIYDEKGPLLEEYCLSFTYFSEITIDLRLTGSTQSIWTMRSDAAESFPLDYEPPFFESYDDMRKRCPLPLHTTLSDYSQDLISLHDVKSVLSNNPFHSNKVFAMDPKSKIQQGHLFCITKKDVHFYFDSGASHHMCDDDKLFKNLHEVPTEHQDTVYDASGDPVCLHMSGEVIYDQIKLSPVFYHSTLKFKVISLGELDDSNTLMYVGDKRIKIFDVNKGEMIGEGYLHEKRNEYIKNLWVVDSLCCNHMTGIKGLLSDTRREVQSFVTPRGAFLSSKIGNVKTSTVTLFNVLYCKGLRQNLISEGQLDRDGYSCTRLAHKCKIQWRGTQEVVGLAHQDDNALYYVDYFHYVSDPSLKHTRNDGECIQKLKRPRQDGSSPSSRKRTA